MTNVAGGLSQDTHRRHEGGHLLRALGPLDAAPADKGAIVM